MMTMNLSCGRIGVRATQAEAVECAHYYGFGSVDPDVVFLRGLSGEELASFRADMRAKHIVWAAAGVPVDFRGAEESYRNGLVGLASFADILNRARVTRAGTWLMFGSNDLTYREYHRTMVTRLRSIAEVFGERGIRLGLEYVGTWSAWTSVQFPWVHSMDETKELIADIGLDNVGFVLDSWHWYHAHETAEDILTLKNEDVVAVDLNDAPAGLDRKEMQDTKRELPCTTGVIPIREFMESLKKIGYDGPVRAEPFNDRLNGLPPDEAIGTTYRAMSQAFAHLD